MGRCNAFLIIALPCVLFLLFITPVLAGPTSTKDVSFSFSLPENVSLSGEWRLYFISVGDFENGSWKFSRHAGLLEDAYIDAKAHCGRDGAFHEIVYEMSPEERAHKGCVINGTYQEVYCFKAVTDAPACESLLPDKVDDAYRLNYKSYYDSAMWDVGRAEFYHHHALASCPVVDGTCAVVIDSGARPYNPFIVVAEQLNSTKEIYFSEPTTLVAMQVFDNTSLFSCGADAYCDVHANVTLRVRDFERVSPHSLRIAFDDTWSLIDARAAGVIPDAGISNESTGLFERFLYWVRSLFSKS